MRLAVHLHVASPIVLAQLLYIALQVWRNQVEASLGTLRAAPVAHPPQPPHMAGPNQETDRLTYRRHLRIQASASRGPSPMVGTRELGYIFVRYMDFDQGSSLNNDPSPLFWPRSLQALISQPLVKIEPSCSWSGPEHGALLFQALRGHARTQARRDATRARSRSTERCVEEHRGTLFGELGFLGRIAKGDQGRFQHVKYFQASETPKNTSYGLLIHTYSYV